MKILVSCSLDLKCLTLHSLLVMKLFHGRVPRERVWILFLTFFLAAGALLRLDVRCKPVLSFCMTRQAGSVSKFRQLVFRLLLQPLLIGHTLHLPGLCQLGKGPTSCG